MSEKEAITIKILDREYRISCDAEERRQLLDAADFLDKQMRGIKDGMSMAGQDKVAVLAGLNIANELLQAKQREREASSRLNSHIDSLREKLSKGLDQFSGDD